MSILSRHILREHLKVLLWILVILWLLCFLFEFVERWDDLLEANVPPSLGFQILLFRMPQYLTYVLPVSALLSSFITVGLLRRSRELTAIRASGISDLFVSRPLLFTAGALSLLSFFWAESLAPAANRRASDLWEVEVEKKPQRRLFIQNEIWFRTTTQEGTTFYHFGFLKVPPAKGYPSSSLRKDQSPVMRDVMILRVSRDFRWMERIDAQEMRWEDGNWVFRNGVRWTSLSGGGVQIKAFQTEVFPLPDRPEDFQWVTRDVEEMGFFALRRYIRRAKEEGYDMTAHQAELHFKVASALFSLIAGLFAIALALRMPLKAGGLVMGVTLSMAVGVLYYLLMATGLALGRSGALPALVGAWGGNILFGAAGLWLLVRKGL